MAVTIRRGALLGCIGGLVAAVLALAVPGCSEDAAGDGGATATAAEIAAPGTVVLGTAEPRYVWGKPAEREMLLDQTAAAGAGIVRINAFWYQLAPTRPADGSDPADRAYRFASLDAAVRAAHARGLDIFLTMQRAPEWAESEPNREDRGAWKPDVAAYGDFVTAVATRYGGSFADPANPAVNLPRVRLYQVWNEANLEKFFAPQFAGGKPRSPEAYRALLNHAYARIKAVNPDNRVILAGSAPKAPTERGARIVSPDFWRALFCLDGKLRPKPCPQPANFDIFDHHPITVDGPPHRPGRKGSVLIANYRDLGRILRAAERHGTIGGPAWHPMWASEIYWETDPPETRRGFPPQKAARYLAEGIYLLARQDVSMILNFFMIDAPFNGKPGDVTNIQAGLLDQAGRRKPAFSAFRFPFVVDRKRGRVARVWGISPRAGTVVVTRRKGKRWRPVARFAASERGVFGRLVKPIRQGQRLRAQIGGERSLTWKVR